MAWKSTFMPPFPDFVFAPSSVGPFRVNDLCFVRKQHKCGKVFGASKSCFIACPADDELEHILGLMSEKLTKVGIEPIIAVKERAYGQDIFCTKICGKIIEARFCVVILDDSIKNGSRIPNPNVYYEYGLMTALGKHVIPLQKQDLELAFNIQSHDTIKYNPKNITSELDRAIKDATKITDTQKADQEPHRVLSDLTLARKFELAGFEPRDRDWFLSDTISDTQFKGFTNYAKGFYLILGRVDDVADFDTYLEDFGVALYRIEKKAQELESGVAENEQRKKHILEEQDAQGQEMEKAKGFSTRLIRDRLDRSLREVEETLRDARDKLELMSTFFVGFVLSSQLDPSEFMRRAREVVTQYTRYKLVFSSDKKISFDDVIVNLGEQVQ